MALRNVKVPLYNSGGEDEERKLIINEFAGRCDLSIKEKGKEYVEVSCYFEDLERAWKAVKR